MYICAFIFLGMLKLVREKINTIFVSFRGLNAKRNLILAKNYACFYLFHWNNRDSSGLGGLCVHNKVRTNSIHVLLIGSLCSLNLT